MSPNSDKTTKQSEHSTETKRTVGTSAATHLDRLAALIYWMQGEQEENASIASSMQDPWDKERASGYQEMADYLTGWGISVRWAIDRETGRQASEELSK